MDEEERKAVEILNTFELRRKTKNYKEISLEDTQSVKIILNLIEKLQKENEKLKALDLSNSKMIANMSTRHFHDREKIRNSIPKQTIKDKIEGIQKEYNKLDKQVDEYINDVNKDLSTYYENKERIAIMQTLMWFIGVLQELIEESEKK